jgi:hypothetical protein
MVPDYRHRASMATIANPEDMRPTGWVSPTLPSGGRDGLRTGRANSLSLVAREGLGLPWIPFPKATMTRTLGPLYTAIVLNGERTGDVGRFGSISARKWTPRYLRGGQGFICQFDHLPIVLILS